MKLLAALAIATAAGLAAINAHAALPVGAKAPDFSTKGAHGGKPFDFSLKAALKNGPVVLYFYPKAFTHGCTLEAHAFAAAMDDFHKAGATVIGLSADDLPALQKFSMSECQSRFTVAIASPAVVRQYDVAMSMAGLPIGVTNRTTYVIDRDGTVRLSYSALDWREHVGKALETVRALAR